MSGRLRPSIPYVTRDIVAGIKATRTSKIMARSHAIADLARLSLAENFSTMSECLAPPRRHVGLRFVQN